MTLKEMVVIASIGSFSLAPQSIYAQETQPPEPVPQKQVEIEKSLETRLAEIEQIFKKTQWGAYFLGTDPAEYDAQKIATYGDLAIDSCIKYANGNLSQRKTSMKALQDLTVKGVDICRAKDTIINVWQNDPDWYVRNLALVAIHCFEKETLLRLSLSDNEPEVRAEVIIPLARTCLGFYPLQKEDRGVRDYLGGIINDRDEDPKVRTAATYWGCPKDKRLERIVRFINDPNEPIAFRKELVSKLANYKGIESGLRNSEELPVEDYELLRKTVIELSQNVNSELYEEAKKLSAGSSNPLRYITSELCILYFKRGRLHIDKNNLGKAKEDLYRAMVLATGLPFEESQIILSHGIFTTGYNYPGGYHPVEVKSIFNELMEKENNPKVSDALRQGIAYIDSQLQKYPQPK